MPVPAAPVSRPAVVRAAEAAEEAPETPHGNTDAVQAVAVAGAVQAVDVEPETVYDGFEDSDVFLCKEESRPSAVPAVREVTLFVYGWSQVEPGLLSWTFQDLRSALDAVQRMKNAIAWCIVQGTGWDDLAAARTSGKVLVEQLA
ncbi:MAG: hypothetical protein KIT84_12925 [Labilithrix sp.]|nr:hypothetical protein [Labilithrix sp.]MCW5811918.1 hypothetical protein [Labilithrix sp.]